jgi:hypothetical protein
MSAFDIRDFDGDLEALSTMAHAAWLEEYGRATWPDLYRPELTRHLFAEVPDPRYLIGAYHGTQLVAFVAILPRTYRFRSNLYKGVAPCMLVVQKGHRGAGAYLIGECRRRIQEFEADFALMTLERRHRSWLFFERFAKGRYRIEVLKTMYTILHAVDFAAIAQSENLKWYEVAAVKLLGAHRPITAPAVSGTVRLCHDGDVADIHDLTTRYPDCNSLVRVFDQGALARRLQAQDVASTVVYERNGAVRGFINYTVHDMVSRRGSRRWAWMDFLYWEGLNGSEKQALLAGMWAACRNMGCIGILEWSKNYYGKWALFRSHFIPYPRSVDLVAWVLNPTLSLQGIGRVVEQVI